MQIIHNKSLVFLFVLAFTNLQSLSVRADGMYLGAKAGITHNDHSCGAAAFKCDRDDMGYGVFAGYDFSHQYRVEISILDLGDSSAKYPTVNLEGELSAADLSLKYSYPFLGGFHVFAKAGVAYWQGEVQGWGVKVDDSGFSPAFGAGVTTPVWENLSARLEYQYFDDLGNQAMGYTQQHFLSVGLSWSFSEKRTPTPSIAQSVANVAPIPEPVQESPSVIEAPSPIEPADEPLPIIIDERGGGPLFAHDSSSLEINQGLQEIVTRLLRNPTLFVRIVGHTDDRGSSQYNQKLSESRAQKVAEYLEYQGVSRHRITAAGAGEENPIADNSTAEGRAQNRRVEFFISGTANQ